LWYVLTNETHVDSDEQHDWLREEDAHGTTDVPYDQLLEVDFDFLLLCMNPPVLGASPELGRFVDEDHRRVCLLHEEEQQTKGGKAHKRADVFRPAPPKIARCDEASYERGQERAHEDGRGEDCNRETTKLVVEHVGEDGGNDGKRAGAEETGKEAADENGLEVFAYGHCDAEDGKTEGGNDDGGFSTVQLGHGRPHLSWLARSPSHSMGVA
jgi:hypothetical protein